MGLFREDFAHPALWVLLITIPPRDQVDMRMEDRLSGALAAIHAEVEPGNHRIHLLYTLAGSL